MQDGKWRGREPLSNLYFLGWETVPSATKAEFRRSHDLLRRSRKLVVPVTGDMLRESAAFLVEAEQGGV